jgi:hypothetical protein
MVRDDIPLMAGDDDTIFERVDREYNIS